MQENNLQQKKPAIKQSWLRILLFVLMYLISSVILSIIAGTLLVLTGFTTAEELQSVMGNKGNINIMIFSQLFSLIAAAISIWVFRKFVDKKTISSLGFEIKGKFKDIIGGFLVGFILLFLGFIVLYFTNQLTVTGFTYSAKDILGSLILFIIVAVVEESIFRGYVLSNLMGSLKNKYIALLISAAIFALFHGINPNISVLGFINLILAGLALGITYIHTKNLWFPIFLHISWNYFQGPIFGFEVSGLNIKSIINHDVVGSDLITGGKFGFEGSILLTFLLIGMVIVVDRFLAKKIA
ncbi:lysostaphin resistance A-like protein [Bacteroidota bacterium]